MNSALRPLLFLALASALVAGDPPSPLAQAPQAVQATVAKRFPQAAVTACSGDGAKGWTVTLTDAKGQHHVLALSDDGKLTKDNGNDPGQRPAGWRRARIAR